MWNTEWHVAHKWEGRGVYRVLVGKPEGNTPLGRPRHRWEDITLRWIFMKLDVVAWIGSIWLKIGADGRHLSM
jgi:hypothetical protein